MKKHLLAIVFFNIVNALYAQPAIDWLFCFGGTDLDYAFTIIQTPDSGYFVCGYAASNDSDVSGNLGEKDVWLIKLNKRGLLQWQRCYGGSEDDNGVGMILCPDGSLVIAATSRSENGGMIQGHHDTTAYLNADFLVFKVDSTGNLIWSHCYGGTSDEYASSIAATPDGGFIVGGSAYSINWDVSGNHGYIDFWMIKIDSIGILQWQKCLGGSYMDYGHSVVVTNDSGFAITGSTESTDGEVTNNHGSGDFWLARTDSLGNLLWQKCYGGSAMEDPYSLIQTRDGGFAIGGFAKSTDGDITGLYGEEDFWIVKTNSLGILQWQKCLGGYSDDRALSINENANGEFTLTGWTESYSGDVSGSHGLDDTWIVNIDSAGNFQWQMCIGGSLFDAGYSIISTLDGGCIVTGATWSNDFNISGNNGAMDFLVVKLRSFNVDVNNSMGYTEEAIYISPNPTSGKIKISLPQSSNDKIEIYNLMGEKLMESSFSQADISSFPSGIYIVHVSDGEKIWRGKVVKQ